MIVLTSQRCVKGLNGPPIADVRQGVDAKCRDPKDVDWNPQYEYMGESGGACPTFCCKEGPVTLARLARVDGEYVMQIANGQAVVQDKETFKEARDRWPHAFIIIGF